METSYHLKYAGFWIRLWAYVIDLVIISSIGWLIVRPIFRLVDLDLTATIWYAPITVISVIIFYSYFTLMTYFFQQTLGKMIVGIRVVASPDNNLSFGTVVFRETIGRILSVIPFNLPYVIVGFTPKKQAVHDYIADTFVVHEDDYQRAVMSNQLHQPNTVQ